MTDEPPRTAPDAPAAPKAAPADDRHYVVVSKPRFGLGDIVRHRLFPFRGVVFDVDAEFQNSEEWWLAIPEELRPTKNQPFYHLLAENDETSYIAYVSQQNLLPDDNHEPVRHPAVTQLFQSFRNGRYQLRPGSLN